MRRIYAADFGAGNTCIFYADPDASVQEISELNNPGGEPSGYAIKENGDILLGVGLFNLTYDQIKDINSFHINIKATPKNKNKEELVQYFRAWREKIEYEHSEEFDGIDEPYWFIGCPTGNEWKLQSTRDLYKSIFEEAGYRNVFIVPESNAAFAYYQKISSIKDRNTSSKNYLLIDQGAYSLDATYFGNGTITSYGGYLGSSLIERMMIHVILESDEQSIRFNKRRINLPETIQSALNLLHTEGWNGKFHTYLLLKARALKEKYFTNLSNGTLIETTDSLDILDIEFAGDALILFLNSKIMDTILERNPIKEVLGAEFSTLAPEVQECIGNKTWMQAFRDFLSEINHNYPNINDGSNTVIMLTGGGSLMNCVSDAVKNHYKNAVVHCDKQSLSAIGKGMAYWAPDKIKAYYFEMAFKQFIEKETVDSDGNTINCVKHYLNQAYIECLTPSIQAIIQEEKAAVTDSIIKWREYHYKSNNIPTEIEEHLRKWCTNTGIQNFKSTIEKKVIELKSSLNRDFNTTLDSFSIPNEDILTDKDKIFLSNTSKAIPDVFSAIVDLISSYYKRNDLWDNFPNVKKGLFSNPRADFFKAREETLTEWIDQETKATVNLCVEVFCNFGVDRNDVNWTLHMTFIYEGLSDLTNLMKAHRNEILGQLVLEECIDDSSN